MYNIYLVTGVRDSKGEAGEGRTITIYEWRTAINDFD
jgi:hypothetical protein